MAVRLHMMLLYGAYNGLESRADNGHALLCDRECRLYSTNMRKSL
jgi:hypothetical protein